MENALTPERWQQIKDLFNRAAECDPTSRLEFIGKHCGGDEELRREVESLLASDPETGSLLDNPLMETGTDVSAGCNPAISLPAPNDSFGPYVPIRILGEGGMGTVYLARQQHPIRREVALKVVKLGMDSRQVLERFESERQVLALMEYPNVARVLDAGTSERGRPYFVMEYVDGVPITQYCDGKALSTRQRLELFIPVCNALQHAHKKGIIHRDVKPSNVLVTEVDGHAVPKVIDFGIARATDQRAAEGEAFTLAGQIVGTPEYMSPEQADMDSRDIDTGTDVYSLGVVLYELLVGVLPLDIKALRKIAFGEVLRAIRETPVPKPIARITQMGAAAEAVALQRSTFPGQLKRELSGDLDCIVMKAIEKDRHFRYASASDFAADIERYLRSEPVLAGPPGAAYRMRKFVVRHKRPVAAAAAVVLALIAGIITTAWQARVAGQQRAVAISEKSEAERQRALAVQQGAEAAKQRDVAQVASARATAAERVATKDRDHAVAAERAATNDRDRAVAAEGRAQQERNTALAEKRRADNEAAATAAVNDFLLNGLREQASTPIQAENEPDPNLKASTALDRDRATAELMARLGGVYFAQAKYAQAVPLLTQALENYRRALGEEHRETVAVMYTLGALYYNLRNYAQAEPHLTRALELYRRLLGAEDSITTNAKLTLSRLRLDRRKYEEAEPLLRETLNDYEKLPDGWMRYRIQSLLGENLTGQRKFPEAEPLLLSGYLGMIQREPTIPRNNLQSVDTAGMRVVRLYLGWGKAEQAAEWRAKLHARTIGPFIKDGNVVQDPEAPISFRLAPGWTLSQAGRWGDHETNVVFVENESRLIVSLYYQHPLQASYPVDTNAALREGMEAKVRELQERIGSIDAHIRAGSVQSRLVGGHPALSFIVEFRVQGQSRAEYYVRVLGKRTKAHFMVEIPQTADIDAFYKRLEPIVSSLRIP